VRVGFEPTEPAKVQRFSRPPDSTTLAPHRILILPGFLKLQPLSPRVFSAQWAMSPIWHHFPQSTQPPAFSHRGSCVRNASSQIPTRCILGACYQAPALLQPRLEGQSNPPLGTDPPTKRILGVFPNYSTSPSLSPYVPISSKQKFKIASEDALDPGGIVVAATAAGIAQLLNSNRVFGQEVSGYGGYFAAAYGNHVIGDFTTEGSTPACFIRVLDTLERVPGPQAAG
jgi:hypothetical protein